MKASFRFSAERLQEALSRVGMDEDVFSMTPRELRYRIEAHKARLEAGKSRFRQLGQFIVMGILAPCRHGTRREAMTEEQMKVLFREMSGEGDK